MKRGSIAAVLAASLAASAMVPATANAQAKRGLIEIVVWNIRKGIGHVRVDICTKTTFVHPHRACPYHGAAPALAGVTTVMVPDVPAGDYAAQVFQDEQDIGKVPRSVIGLPLVGVGFSNDAPTPMRSPRFEDALFAYDPNAPLTLRIKLRYYPAL